MSFADFCQATHQRIGKDNLTIIPPSDIVNIQITRHIAHLWHEDTIIAIACFAGL